MLRDRSSRQDADPIPDAVAGMNNHRIAFFEATEDLGFQPIVLANLNRAELRPAAFNAVDSPLLSLQKQAPGRDLEDVLLLPDDDLGFHAIGIAQGPPLLQGADEIDDDIDALLLD